MKKFLLGTVALVALGAAAPALAADLAARPYTKAPAYAAPIYNWTGFYIGGHIGGEFAGNNSLTGSDGRFLGGVQGGFDYLFKMFRYSLSGYRLNVHVNGQSPKGYILALAAALVGRLCFRPALVTFHGGLSQRFFPRRDSNRLLQAFKLLFQLAGGIACDSDEIKQAIKSYGVNSEKIASIGTFSAQYLDFQPVTLAS